MARRVLMGLIAAAVVAAPAAARRDLDDPLAVLSARPEGSRHVPNEAEWAAQLVDALGLDRLLSSDAEAADHFALLCADRARVVTESGGRAVPGSAALRVSVEPPAHKGPGEPVRMVVNLPSTTLYLFSVEGVGSQRWALDGRLVGHMDPSSLGVAQAPTVLPLRQGPHELAGYLSPRARVERVELAAYRSLCIAPADGWHAERPLRLGVMARTLVHAVGLEKNLPAAGPGIPVEGEDFAHASGGGEKSERRLYNEPSAKAWARASEAPAEFTYRVHLEEPGLFSILGRLPGGGTQIWSVDGRYRATLEPQGRSSRFAWNHVLTLPLASGSHVIRVFASRGSGVDVMRLVPHTPSDAAYVTVLGQAGDFPDGAPDSLVTRRVARASLSQPLVTQSAERFLYRYAEAPTIRSLLADEAARNERKPPPPAAPDPAFRPETWR